MVGLISFALFLACTKSLSLPQARRPHSSFALNQAIEYPSNRFGFITADVATEKVQMQEEKVLGKEKIEGEGARIFFKARQEESEAEFPEAQKLYQEVLTIEPTFIYAWSNLGNVLTAQGYLDDALLCYKKAISLRPPTSTLGIIILNKASTELSLDQNDAALRDFEIAEKIAGPESRDTIFTNKAVALSNKGDWASACALFDSVIKSAERNALPWWLRYSMALLETSRGVEAVGYAQRSLNRFPGEVECNAFATALYTSLGSKEASLPYWNSLTDEDKKIYTNPEFLEKKLHWGPKARAGFADFLVYNAKRR